MFHKLILFYLFTLTFSTAFSQLSNSDSELLKRELLQLINDYRSENGLTPLQSDEILEKAATSQSEYMAKYDTLTHTQKRGTLKTPQKRVKYFKGKMFESVDEIILYERVKSFRFNKKDISELATTLFLDWQSSITDNATMLNMEYAFCGISIASDTKKSRVFATLVLASKGIEVEGQLSSNGFGLRSAPENCTDQYAAYINLVLNIGNSIRIEGDELVFYHHNINLFKRIFNSTKDGIAIDLIRKSQFPCNGPNQLDASKVYNGVLLKPMYRNEI